MKKMIALLMALLLVLGCTAAHAEAAPTQFPGLGMQITMPENAAASGLGIIANEEVMNLTFQNSETYTALLLIERLPQDVWLQIENDPSSMANLSQAGMRLLGQQEGYAYIAFIASDYENVADYFSNVTATDFNSFSDATREAITAALPLVKQAAESLTFIPIVPQEKKVGAFTTLNLKGETVTESIFSGYDLTVINVWGTFCGPCIGEMPEMAAWHKELPENVQLIGIVSDVSAGGDPSGAEKILKDTGVEFENLLASESLYPLLSMSQYVPTTYFVDSEGRMVGDPIVGADVAGYKYFVEDYLK